MGGFSESRCVEGWRAGVFKTDFQGMNIKETRDGFTRTHLNRAVPQTRERGPQLRGVLTVFAVTALSLSLTGNGMAADPPPGAVPGVIFYTRTGGTDGIVWAAMGNGSADVPVTMGGFPRVSPDGRYMLFLRNGPSLGQGDLWMKDLVTGQETFLFDNTDYIIGTDWTLDSGRFYFDHAARSSAATVTTPAPSRSAMSIATTTRRSSGRAPGRSRGTIFPTARVSGSQTATAPAPCASPTASAPAAPPRPILTPRGRPMASGSRSLTRGTTSKCARTEPAGPISQLWRACRSVRVHPDRPQHGRGTGTGLWPG